MSKQELETVAQSMVAKGKGILAADESMGTIKRRFDSIKIESNDHNRRAYRDLLFTTKGIEEAISGVILFDETIRTAALDGTPFPQLLSKKGIMPGIKVDKGPVDIPGFPGEVVTEGLDGLRARVKEYKELGAKFAKWRAVITIGDSIPTYTCLEANAHALARYAALMSGGRDRTDRGAGSPARRLPYHRTLPRSDGANSQSNLHGAFPTAGPSGRNDTQAEHGGIGQGKS